MLTPERWDTLKNLFDAALQIEPSQRDGFIRVSCGGDEELKESLRRLLDRADVTGDLLDRPVASLVSEPGPVFAVSELVAGRFGIVSFIGRGGMGEVYKAFDRELQEHVALKTIRSDSADPTAMQQRLRQEVKRARKIAHPNVCRVYDFFLHQTPDGDSTAFLTMQYIEGTTLAEAIETHGPLSAALALPLFEQILSGLGAAHRAEIIHRDFKPANVILVGLNAETYRAVVTDFGIAKDRMALTAAVSSGPASRQTVIGTPAYMAPEQFRGHSGVYSDLYAFGAVMFEMLTGFPPDFAQADAAHVLSDSSLPPEVLARIGNVPGHWRQVIRKCLEIRPADRYGSADEVLSALRAPSGAARSDAERKVTRRVWVAAGITVTAGVAAASFLTGRGSGGVVASLIVLPLRGDASNPDETLIAEGLTDGLMEDFRHHRLLRVIAHNSAFEYRGSNPDPARLNRDLRVSHVLSGDIAIRGESTRASFSLTTAPQGQRIWGKTYSGMLSSAPALVAEVARDVSSVLKAGGDDRNERNHSEFGVDAYKLYLRGRYAANLRSEAGLRQSIGYFNDAIGIEPKYDRAYSGLADSYSLLAVYGYAPPRDVMPPATMAAQKALSINESLAEAFTSLGLIRTVYEWDWTQARTDFDKALDLDPGYSTGHQWLAYYLAWRGQAAEARAHMLRAQTFDPLALSLIHSLGWLAFWSRDYKAAEAHLRHGRTLNPNYGALYVPLANAYAEQRNFEGAFEALNAGARLSSKAALQPQFARIMALAGRKAEAAQAIAEVERTVTDRAASGVSVAMAYEAMGNTEKALEWLYAVLEERGSQLCFIKVDPRVDGLRSSPRFRQLLDRTRLS